MKPLKFKRIEIRAPKWDPHPEKSTTNNHEWRKGLFIIFEDYSGNVFDYMPKWNELQTILKGKESVEAVNKKLCKENLSWKKIFNLE
jgi:hypothetical protein